MILKDERRRRGTVLVTPAIQMTAAASGSSGIVVADSNEYDFAASDFGIVWRGRIPSWRPVSFIYLVYKYADDNNRIGLILESDGTLKLFAVFGGALIFEEISSAPVPESLNNQVVQLTFAVVRETASVAGSFTPYLNAAVLGSSQAITAASTISISNTGVLYINGTDSARYASDTVSFILLNFSPTASQVAQLYSSGIPAEWMWGDNSDVYGLLPGSSTAFYSSPDSAASSVTGDIEIIVRAALDLPTSDQCFISKYSSSPTPQRSYIFRVVSGGFLQLALSPDGSADVITNSSAAHGSSAGAVAWFRATWSDSSDAVNFYTSTTDTEDPSLVSWTLLGDADRPLVSAGIYEGTAPVAVGIFDGSSNAFDGKIYRAQVYSGIGGTLAVDFNPRDYGHNTTFVSKQTGETWTLNGAATIEGIGATLALLSDTLPTSGALAWTDSSGNTGGGTLPAAGATKVTIRK